MKLIVENAQKLRNTFKDIHIAYSVKANTNPHILKIIKSAGIGFEVVSKGEL